MMMRFFYNIGIMLFSPVIVLFLIIRYRLRFLRYFLDGMSQRLGHVPGEIASTRGSPVIWLHAASVGELNLLKPLVRELRSRYLGHRICISTITPEAFDLARESRLADASFYAPIDFFLFTRRAVRRVRPSLLLLAESEFWPNLIIESKKAGAVVGVVNTRVSDRTFGWMKRFPRWYRYIFSNIDFFAVRGSVDKDRIDTFNPGKDNVILTGNIKYDAVNLKAALPAELEKIRARFRLKNDDQVLVCGSVHPGETAVIAQGIRMAVTAVRKFKVIIVPRHIEKAGRMVKILARNGVSAGRYSLLSDQRKEFPGRCLVLDTLGDLTEAYQAASVVFVGGSLVKHGGQNIIEPALLEKPVLFGPHMRNFAESSGELLRCGGAAQVHDEVSFANTVIGLLNDRPARMSMARSALAAASGLKGAATATVRLIQRYV